MAHLAHYREAHPLPFVITHWVNLVCMIFLIFSGFLIHFPFWAALTGVARGLHVAVAMIWVLNCIVRVVMAFLVYLHQRVVRATRFVTLKPGFLRKIAVTSSVLGLSTISSLRRPILWELSLVFLRRSPTYLSQFSFW